MSEPLAYLNGQFLPYSAARLPLHDAGFVFGATITDLTRTFHHTLYRLADHLCRFRQSCALARVPQPVAEGELGDIAETLVTHNCRLLSSQQELALVLFATPGPIGHYAGLSIPEPLPTLGLHTFPLPFARWQSMIQNGIRLVVPTTRHVPADCVAPAIKQRSRLHWWQAEQEAHEIDPSAAALLLDTQGFVTETAAANLLIVCQGQVWSPNRQRILGGIGLQIVEEMCRELGIPFAECDVRLDDCRGADEAFLSNSAFCLAPVRQIDDTIFPVPGPIYERLLHHWSQQVGLDIRAQILAAG